MKKLLVVAASLVLAAPLQAQRQVPPIPKDYLRAALIGGVIGGVVGGAVGLATAEECGTQEWFCFEPEFYALTGAATGFLAGALVGVIVEAIDGDDRPKNDPRRVQMMISPERASFRVSLPLPNR